MSLHTLFGPIFHSNAFPFWHTLHEKSQLSTSGVWILRHLYSHEFFTRSALLLLYILSTLPFPSSSLKSGIKTFLTSHTCFMGISRLGREICKLNGINEKAEQSFFSSRNPLDDEGMYYLSYWKHYIISIIGYSLMMLYEKKEILNSYEYSFEDYINSIILMD